MTVAQIGAFYRRDKWGSRWGVIDAAHPTPHKGLDIINPGRTSIPALRAGVVVKVGSSASVGPYVTVQVGPGDFDTYCHDFAPVGVGQRLNRGDQLALVAGFGDNHGSAWTGPHTHYVRSTTVGGWAFWGGANISPYPVLDEALAVAAAAGVPGSVTPITNGDLDMPTLIRHPNGTITTLGETTYQHHTSIPSYLADTASFGPYKQLDEAQFNQAIANTQVRLAYLKAGLGVAPGGGSVVDVAAIALKTEQQLADDFKRLADQVQALDQQIGELDLDPADLAAVTAAAKAGANQALAGLQLVAKTS